MRTTILVAILTVATLQSSFGQNLTQVPQQQSRGKLWKLSAVALAVATSVDAHSSWGHVEINPALRGPNGRFGMQGIAMKGLVTAGVLGAQYMLLRNHPKAERYGVITNFALGGVLGSAALYNYRLHSGKPAINPSSLR